MSIEVLSMISSAGRRLIPAARELALWQEPIYEDYIVDDLLANAGQ